ncbi:MAG: ATP-dependent Clp protease proteolytic subunit [Candidatus Hodgkinia cicadicola]
MIVNKYRRENWRYARSSKADIRSSQLSMLECLPEQEFFTRRLMLDRVIMLSGEITTQTATAACSLLLILDAESGEEDICVYINSPGGEVNAGLAIYDTMQLIRPDVKTVCLGQAASTASILLAGGAKGKRYCTPNSIMMVHQLSSDIHGQVSDLQSHTKNMLTLKELVTKIYAKHCNKSYDEVARTTDRDYFMCAEAALKWGLVDLILEKGL